MMTADQSWSMEQRKQRSTRITARRTIMDDRQWLMQWHYTQRGHGGFGAYTKSGFRSIVTRPGMPGLWLDVPYYCYGGEHRYRKLPTELALRVYLCCARGWLLDKAGRLRAGIEGASNATKRALGYWSPTAVLRRRREVLEWEQLWR